MRSLLIGAVLVLATQSPHALQVGEKAPDFSLASTTSSNIQLSDFLGRKSVVIFFYNGAFQRVWTQEALAFQLDLPKFEAVNAQVLGVSVDFNAANSAWAEKLGLTYPLLSDAGRAMSRAYQSLYDDAAMVNSSRISTYLRSKRSWFIIDKHGFIRYMKIESSTLVPSDELIEVAKKYQ